MRWSFKLATIAGTALYVHVTFFLLLVWVAWIGWQAGGAAAALNGIVFILLVFLCVVLHEFGHVAAARRYGIRTPDITLLPIGGLANLERMPQKPMHELIVAIAGPMVNLVIAVFLFAALLIWPPALPPMDADGFIRSDWGQMPMAWRILGINVALLLFNLIPAFPMDGGRMLRAVLAMVMDRPRATLIAARTGQAFAVLFAIIGLMGNPFLLLIAVFIFLAASAENSHEQVRAASIGRRARDAMIVRYESLGPDNTVEDASRLLLLTTQQEFPVLDTRGAFLGMVTRKGLVEAMQQHGPAHRVSQFMERKVASVAEDTDLTRIMAMIGESPARSVAVRDGTGRFLGYVSAENAAELFMIEAARRSRA